MCAEGEKLCTPSDKTDTDESGCCEMHDPEFRSEDKRRKTMALIYPYISKSMNYKKPCEANEGKKKSSSEFVISGEICVWVHLHMTLCGERGSAENWLVQYSPR